MEMSEIITKINELNGIKKIRNLTETEISELSNYRKLYLEKFKKNVKNILENTKVVDEQGKDITPKRKDNNK